MLDARGVCVGRFVCPLSGGVHAAATTVYSSSAAAGSLCAHNSLIILDISFLIMMPASDW